MLRGNDKEPEDQLQIEQLREELRIRQRTRDPAKLADVIHDLVARRGYTSHFPQAIWQRHGIRPLAPTSPSTLGRETCGGEYWKSSLPIRRWSKN